MPDRPRQGAVARLPGIALWAAVVGSGARAVLLALQDGYLARGLPALGVWSLADGLLDGLRWTLPAALLLAWAASFPPRRARAARATMLVGATLLGFAFVTCRLPAVPSHVPELESLRGWLGNAAGLFGASLAAVPLAFQFQPDTRTWTRASASLAGLAVLAAAGVWIAVPLVGRAPIPPPFSVRFEDATTTAGIDVHGLSWSTAWGDFDADGWPDLWLGNHGAPRLLANRGGLFVDVSTERIEIRRGDCHGAAWADFDADGDLDLLELSGAGRGHGAGANHLYRREGAGFVERAAGLGLDYPAGRGRTPLWVDWDADGALDVLLTCAERADADSALFLQRDGAFVRAGEEAGFVAPEHALFAQLARLGAHGNLFALVQANHGSPQRVFDLGCAPPRDVTRELAIPVTYRSEDVAIADLDGDLAADLFVTRRHIESELERRGERGLTLLLFDDGSGGASGVSFRSDGALTVGVSPVDDLWWRPERVFLGAGAAHPDRLPARIEPDAASASGDAPAAETADRSIRVRFDPGTRRWSVHMLGAGEQATIEIDADAPITELTPMGFGSSRPVRNAVYLWRGGRFEDATDRVLARRELFFRARDRDALLAFGTECSAVAAGDFDNDMDVDLYVACATGLRNLENYLLENLGDGRLREIPGASGAPGSAHGIADALAVADYDRDGFLDLLVSNGRGIGERARGPVQLYRNGGNANHWLELDLEGTASNRDAIGAEVRVSTGGRSQVRLQGGGMHRGAQDFQRLHFGLGPHERVDELVVRWPSGAETTLRDVAADRILHVVESSSFGSGSAPPR